MSTFPKIEKDIPITPKGTGVKNFTASLAPGDSFVCTFKESRTWRVYFSRAKIKITTRTLDDGNLRIWVTQSPFFPEA